jgi:L-ascorbate metabolism protein UlaG (beta-lactamase superfamily)
MHKTLLRCLVFLFLNARLAVAQDCKVEITYLANEGVMLRSGSQKVLIDAVFNKAMDPYLNLAPDTLKQIETATGEFKDVTLILATHFHVDHFDANTVAAHLKSSPHTTFLGSTQMTEMVLKAMGVTSSQQVIASDPNLRTHVEVNGIDVEVLNVMHTMMRPDVQHRAYIVHLGGEKILHLGDADGREKNIAPQRLADEDIDVALVPEWYLDREDGAATLRNRIKPKHIGFIHVPPVDAKEASELAKKSFGGIALTAAGEKHCY